MGHQPCDPLRQTDHRRTFCCDQRRRLLRPGCLSRHL
jgi:hypothetical protein